MLMPAMFLSLGRSFLGDMRSFYLIPTLRTR